MSNSKYLIKGILILSILSIFLIVGVASAANENGSSDTVLSSNDDEVVSVVVNREQVSFADKINNVGSSGDTNNTLNEINDVVLSSEIKEENKLNTNNDREILADDEYKPLSDLDTLIKVTPNSLLLTNNYKYVDSVLTISKNNMIIDFNGHIIDANNYEGTFLTITGNNVTIKNLKIINAKGILGVTAEERIETHWFYTTDTNAAYFKYYYARVYPINWAGNFGTMDNCTFTNNNILLNWTGNNGVINNSLFNNSKHSQLKVSGSDFLLANTNITHISRMSSAAPINKVNKQHVYRYDDYIVDFRSSATMVNCNFDDVQAKIVYSVDSSVSFYNSNFTNSKGLMRVGNMKFCNVRNVSPNNFDYNNDQGDLLYVTGDVEYCNFDNCIDTSVFKRYALLGSTVTSNMQYCNFTNNNFFIMFYVFDIPLHDCLLENNTIRYSLYGIYAGKDGQTTQFKNAYFYNTIFKNNVFSNNFLLSVEGSVRVYNSSFINNVASNSLFIHNADNLIIKNSVFSTNNEFDGWAIKMNSVNRVLSLDNNTIFNNHTSAKYIIPDTYNSELYPVIYVSPNGNGDGLSEGNRSKLTTALLAKLEYGGIIDFENNGEVYTSIIAITTPCVLRGNGATFTLSNSLYVRSSYVTIENITFEKCTNIAIIYSSGDGNKVSTIYFLTVKNCTFKDNVGTYAGAISTHNNPSNAGGNNGAYLTVDRCKFINNQAKTTILWNDWTSRNHGYWSVGAIFACSAQLVINNTIFDGNHGVYTGAVASIVKTIIENCNFTNNYATNYNNNLGTVGWYNFGGSNTAGAVALYNSNKGSYIDGCRFENNSAPIAGAINHQGNSITIGNYRYGKVRLSDSIFIGNNATTRQGGAVYFMSNDAVVSNCSFMDNYAFDNGASIYNNGNNLVINNCKFKTSFVNNSAGSAIGISNLAYTLGQGYIYLGDCVFEGSLCPIVDFGYCIGDVYNCNFTNNLNVCLIVNKSIDGQVFTVVGSNFINNTGNIGAAIFSIVKTTILQSNFINNNATNYAGAVYLKGFDSFISDSSFINNFALNQAGAVYIDADNVYIENSQFRNNTANSTVLGGGALYVDGETLIILSTSFTGNKANNGFGGAIYINVVGNETIYYSIDQISRNSFKDNKCYNHTGEPLNKDWNNIYDGGAILLLNTVYVVLHPESWMGNDGIVSSCSGESWENATWFGYALQLIAPYGRLIFVNGSGEIYTPTNCNLTEDVVTFLRYNIILQGNNTTFSGIRFVIDERSKSFKLYNSTFTNNFDSCIIWKSVDGLIDNCTFKDNIATGNYIKGLAVQSLANNLKIINSKFINNSIEGNVNPEDGGMLFVNSSNVNITYSTFKNNSANYGSHILLSPASSNILIDYCEFINGSGIDSYGHAIKVDSSGNVVISHSNFTSNKLRETGSWNGGAIIVESIEYFVISNCRFENNTATSNGGAISFTGLSNLVSIYSNVFISNNLTGYYIQSTGIYYNGNNGGAIYSSLTEFDSHDNEFISNNAYNLGGAIYTNGNLDTVRDVFYNNTASQGGAIYNNGKLTLNNVKFSNNSAIFGGAIYSNATLNAINVIFIANTATKFGGAIFSNANISLISCNYSNNFADFGGALYLNGTSNSLNNVKFINNTASHGSAIYVTAGNKITVRNVELMHNNVTGFHNHNGKESPCGDIHIKDDESITILDNSLKLGNIIYPETICINDIYMSDYIYVSNTGNGLGLGVDDATSLKEGVTHIRPNGKIILISDEVYLDDFEIKNINNVTFVANTTAGTVTFKRNSTNATNKGLISIVNSSVNFENINLEINLDLTNTTLNINNSEIKSNITAGDKSDLNLNNIVVDSSKVTINYETDSSGTINNSSFTNVVGVDHIINIDGAVDLNNISVTDNNLNGSAVYYGLNGGGKITNSTFVNNTAQKGVRNINITDSSKVTLLNNTFDVFVSNIQHLIVVYGENLTINGTFDAGINVPISGIALSFNDTFKTNKTVTVDGNRKFSYILNGRILGVGLYNWTAVDKNSNNTYLINQFNNDVNVIKAVVAANNLTVVEVSYGMNNTIIIKGTFNQTGAKVNYTGVVNVTITNENVTIFNESVNVINGEFSVVLFDQGRLSVGKYDVIVSNNGMSNNDNFTVYNTTFKNNFTVTKTVVGANYITNITVVYGMNDTITLSGTFNSSTYVIGGFARNYTGSVLVSITGPNGTINNTVQVINGKFTVVLNDDGRLASGIYDITVTTTENSVNANYTMQNVTFKNNATVLKCVVGANYTANITVVYGMNNTIIVEGTFNASKGIETINYNGIVTVTINNGIYSITNESIAVNDGKFRAVLVDGGKLGVGIYNITVSSNALSLNANYTVTNITFVNKVNVTKAVVGANYTANITVIYGINDTIIVEGSFNASSGAGAVKYNGNVTVIINNGFYSISNSSVVVRDGKFKAIITDQAKLGVGIYNVSVLSNAQSINANYTVNNTLFTNKVNVTKAVVVCNVGEIEIVYGMNSTITISGNVSNSTYGVKYNGFINITILGTDLKALDVLVSDGKFTTTIIDEGKLSAGKYNISVNSNYINANYTFTNKIFINNMSVIRANVTAFDLVNITVIYGINKTITISGNVSNSTYGVKYNGLINITITNSNTTVSSLNVPIVDGVFNVNIVDMGNLTVGSYDVVVSSNYDNNYTFVSKTFTNNVSVLKYSVSVSINKINITYGEFNTVDIEGNVSNSTFGVLYDGFINVTIGNHTYSNVVVSNGKFTLTIHDLSDYNVSSYNVSIAKSINDYYILNNITFDNYFIIGIANSSMNISSVTEKYGDVVVIPVTSKNITALIAEVYTLDGVKVIGIDIAISGINYISIEGLNVGQYVLNVTGMGDNNHKGCNASVNINIIKATSSLIVDNLTVVYAPGNVTVWYEVINATVDSFKVYDESGNPVNCNITKYKYTFEIRGLKAGNYKFNVTADGGHNYENSSSISNIKIIPAGSKVIVPVVVITYGEIAVLNVSGENITGIQSISILNSTGGVVGDYNFTDFTVNVWNLNSSSVHYNVNVTAKVDENHTVSHGIGWVFVKKAGSAIEIPDNFNITYGDVKTITIELYNVTEENINGMYVVSDGEIVVCDLTRDGTNITIKGLDVGDYALIVESRETTNYNASVGAGNFKVLKASSNITVPALTNMSHLGGNITIDEVVNATGISVKVFDINGNQIKVKVEGFTIIFGRMDVGDYTLNVTTIVDENHAPSSAVGNLHIEKILAPSSVNINGIQNGVFNTINPIITFDIVNKTKVTIVVFKNGTNICVFDSANFKGDIFTIVNLDPGVYNITITNLEDDYYFSSNATALFEVSKAQSLIEIVNIENGIVNATNATVKFNVVNKTNVYVVVYNASGDVIVEFSGFNMDVLSLADLPLGIYNITIKNMEDDYYFGYNVSTTFKVVVPSSIIASDIGRGYNSPYDYVASFTDEFGNPLKNTSVIMTVGGKSYNVTTNENGEAYLTETSLPVGKYNITLFNPVTDTSETYKVDIVERLQENRDIVMDFADGTYYSVRAFGDDAKPIAGVYVSIKVNGVTYDVKTNEDGYALLKIRLNPNVYKITAEWMDYKINKIVVKQILSAKSKVAYKSKNLKYSATLKLSNGNPIAGKIITFKFKGKIYKAKTNAKGIAKIKIKKSVLKKFKTGKKYKICITYSAIDGGYTSINSIYKKIKIK